MMNLRREVQERLQEQFKKPEPKMHSDSGCIVIVSGLPTPDAGKQKKLLKYVYEHIVKEAGEIEKTEHINIPLTEDNMCSGFCLIRFVNPLDAKKCVEKFNGNNSIFGADYTLRLCQYNHIEELRKIPKEFTPRPYIPVDCSEHHKRLYFPITGHIDHEFLLLTKANVNRCTFNGEGISVANTQPYSEKLINISYSPAGTYFVQHYDRSLVFSRDNGTSITISNDPDNQETFSFLRSFKISLCERFVLTFTYTVNEDELDEYDLSKFINAPRGSEEEAEVYRVFEEFKYITVSLWCIVERRVLSTLDNAKLYSFTTVNDMFMRPEDRVSFSSTGNLVILVNRENILVYKTELNEKGIYSVSLQEKLAYPNVTTYLFSPNRYGQDILALFQKSAAEQKPSVYTILNLNAPSTNRSGGRVLAQNSFYITNGRIFWSANGGCLAIITEAQVNSNLMTTIFVVIIRGNSEDLIYDQVKSSVMMVNDVVSGNNDNSSCRPRRQALTVKLEQLEFPQNLYIQSACWSANGSMLALISVPVGSSKEAQEESRKWIRMQKQSNANSLQFSLKALEAFMNHAINDREKLLNDGQAAIYLFTLQEKYGLYPCKLGPPVFSQVLETADKANKTGSATIKIKKVPGITASEVLFSPYNDYLAALNRNDRKELALTLINTTSLEKTAVEIEVIDGCSWDSSGRYLIAYKYGGKSSSFGLYIINVTGMVVYSTTLASLVDNLLSAVWRPYDRALIDCCTTESLDAINKYCEDNYDTLLSAKADESSRKEQIEKSQANWMKIYTAELPTGAEKQIINKKVRDCFIRHGFDVKLSGFDADGNELPRDHWMEKVHEVYEVLEEELAEHTIALADYNCLYADKDTDGASAEGKSADESNIERTA